MGADVRQGLSADRRLTFGHEIVSQQWREGSSPAWASAAPHALSCSGLCQRSLRWGGSFWKVPGLGLGLCQPWQQGRAAWPAKGSGMSVELPACPAPLNRGTEVQCAALWSFPSSPPTHTPAPPWRKSPGPFLHAVLPLSCGLLLGRSWILTVVGKGDKTGGFQQVCF